MQYQKNRIASMLRGATLLWLIPATLSADIIITQGNTGGLENLLFNAPGLELGPALTVQGETQSGRRLDIISSENLEVQGQQVLAEVDTFDVATIQALMGESFNILVFNLNVDNDGTVQFTAAPFAVMGQDTFNVDASGQNFFTLTAINGQTIASVTINLGGGAELEDIGQIRVGDEVAAIPEPGSVLLLGTGIAVVFFSRRRTRSPRI